MSILNLVRRLVPFVGHSSTRIASTICSREEFSCILEREQARAQRSGQPFSVVDFDIGNVELEREVGAYLLSALAKRLRSTDEVGWLQGQHIGVLLYNTTADGAVAFQNKILNLIPDTARPSDIKINTYPVALPSSLGAKEGWGKTVGNSSTTSVREVLNLIADAARPTDTKIYAYPPVVAKRKDDRGATDGSSAPPGEIGQKKDNDVKKLSTTSVREFGLLYSSAMPWWKRLVDVLGASFGLLMLSPVLIGIALFIKAVSSGPVLFRQHRVGYGGKVFTLFKFRTMQVGADPSAHRKYVSSLIRENAGIAEEERVMLKLDDPQIIRFGKFLRASCLDELPQLFNVLLGEMSLVGPRPPIPYEVDEYVRWHTGRFDAVPGMTGLWQVSGKNRLTFKDMARLDIRYARQRCFLLDMKILLMTPIAVFYQIRDSLLRKMDLPMRANEHA